MRARHRHPDARRAARRPSRPTRAARDWSAVVGEEKNERLVVEPAARQRGGRVAERVVEQRDEPVVLAPHVGRLAGVVRRDEAEAREVGVGHLVRVVWRVRGVEQEERRHARVGARGVRVDHVDDARGEEELLVRGAVERARRVVVLEETREREQHAAARGVSRAEAVLPRESWRRRSERGEMPSFSNRVVGAAPGEIRSMRTPTSRDRDGSSRGVRRRRRFDDRAD